MAGKMSDALNQFFTLCDEDKEAKLLRKPRTCLEKIITYLRFYNCEPFERAPWANRQLRQCLPSQYSSAGILRLFFFRYFLR